MLGELFDPKNNSLNAIRLVFACLVVVSHAWVIGGLGDEPELGGRTLGAWSMLGFFGISGYLITRSRLNGRPAARFFRAGFQRIYPRFLVSLLMAACVFAPLSVVLGSPGSFALEQSLTYVARNLFFYPPVISQSTIGTTLAAGDIWNGALWSLFWEACCYLGFGVLGITALRAGRSVLLAVAVLGATGASLAAHAGLIPASELTLTPPLIAAFTGGALLYVYGPNQGAAGRCRVRRCSPDFHQNGNCNCSGTTAVWTDRLRAGSGSPAPAGRWRYGTCRTASTSTAFRSRTFWRSGCQAFLCLGTFSSHSPASYRWHWQALHG